MFSEEELQCPICCYEYARSGRLPRVLHCQHTFCALCLDKMSTFQGSLHTVRCPLCRVCSCSPSSQKLSGYLMINTDIWDLILEKPEPQRDLKKTQRPQVIESLRSSELSKSKQAGYKDTFFSCITRHMPKGRKAAPYHHASPDGTAQVSV